MADGKGFRVIIKVNLPPEEQYHSGHSLIVQGDDSSEVLNLLTPIVGGAEQAEFVLLRFGEYALKGGVKAALGATEALEGKAVPPVPPVPSRTAPASLVTFASNKLGIPADDLAGKSEAEIKELLKGGGK